MPCHVAIKVFQMGVHRFEHLFASPVVFAQLLLAPSQVPDALVVSGKLADAVA